MASRATISFGLVTVPVKLEGVQTGSNNIGFESLHEPCKTKVQSACFCPACEVFEKRDEGNIVKGHKIKGEKEYVIVSDEEKASAAAVPTDEIDLVGFLPLAEIDPAYFVKSYHVVPEKGGTKAYFLLVKAMEKAKLVAVARYAKGRSYLAVLRPTRDRLVLSHLLYEYELKDFEDVPVPAREKITGVELDLAMTLIDKRRLETFDPAAYQDDVHERMKQVIAAKREGGEAVLPSMESGRAQVIDLMDALKQTLAADEKTPKRKKTAPKKKAATRR